MLSVDERLELVVNIQSLTAKRDFRAVIKLLEPRHLETLAEPELGHALAVAYSQSDRQEEADVLLNDLDARFANQGSNRLQRRRANLRAVALLRGGRLEEAEDILLEVQDASQVASDFTFVATATMNLGVISDMRCSWNAALAHYKYALVLFQRLGDRASTAGCYHNLGMLHRQRGDMVEAASCFDRAVEYYAPNGTEEERIATSLERSLVMMSSGDSDAGLALARRALQQALQLKNHRLEGESLRTVGKILFVKGNLEEAVRTLRRALLLPATVANRMLFAEVHEELSVVYAAQGDQTSCETNMAVAFSAYQEMGLFERAERAQERIYAGDICEE